LDEPTSSLDPLAEENIYRDFSKITNDKTVIYISHRMSSTKLSDKILVSNNSMIVAFDTHTNLMKNKNSVYYDMFTT